MNFVYDLYGAGGHYGEMGMLCYKLLAERSVHGASLPEDDKSCVLTTRPTSENA